MDNVAKFIKTTERKLRQGVEAPNFVEFVRRIDQGHPELPRLGKAKLPEQEPLRFAQQPFLRFPESDIARIEEHGSAGVPLISLYGFGLLGTNGPMPLEFTQQVFQRSRNHYDLTMQRFLDIIHHRMATLFFRAGVQGDQSVSFDRRFDDLICDILQSLGGIAPERREHWERYSVLSPYFAAHYACFFGNENKTRDALEIMLTEFLRVPLRIRDLVPGEYDIPKEFRCRLGCSDTSTVGCNSQLGSRYVSLTKQFIVEIGPEDFSQCLDLMPGGKGFSEISEILFLYLDRPLRYTFEFLLHGETVPQAKLDRTVQLGRSCWLGRSDNRKQILHVSIAASDINDAKHRNTYKDRGDIP